MFLIGTVTYPPNQAANIVKRFMKATAAPLPPYIKRHYVLTTAAGEHGQKVLGIYEVDDARMKEGYVELTKYYVNFFDVEGFRYNIEVMMPAIEAIPLLNLPAA